MQDVKTIIHVRGYSCDFTVDYFGPKLLTLEEAQFHINKDIIDTAIVTAVEQHWPTGILTINNDAYKPFVPKQIDNYKIK